ncbi:alkaline phosphatase [Rhizoctonia solani AG-1 IB]|uniref:Alkaline phosphatase n=3 Tax=Thanatephorus cucumeris (strain AG1-IB / isolate 7/3/14) TaxID=1108050 RepID=A0A0B7FQY2_THACB|nr:alkaline phosphatase [Rhizoctonia solani AG-1 IB]
MPQSSVKVSYAALVASALWVPLVSSREHQTPAVIARQATSTCANVPLQTSWQYVAPPKNAKLDFGPPNVPQGKAWNGQPKPGGPKGSKKVRNLILTIPDGFGPASEVFARDFVQWNNTATGWNRQASMVAWVDRAFTNQEDSYVTDSSASATAYSCAIKTYNGAVGIDEDGNPCATVLEAAKRAGYTTGMVVTSRITHATPASFSSHIYDREAEPTIAEQIVGDQPLGRVTDLILGGGLSMFWPNSTTGSSRKDGRDLLAEAKKAGFNVFTTRSDFDALKGGKSAKLPYMGLFTASHMSYEVDRDPAVEPSLLEMTKTALETLKQATRNTKQGFFIMIEASRIDHAAHANDPVGHLHEIVMYNEVVDYLREWVDKNQDTVMIGTADHECGGLTLGGIVTTGEYQYNPEPLAAAKHSSSYLAAQWTRYNGSDPDGFLTDLFAQYGINDANSTEIAVAKANKGNTNFIDTHIGQAMGRRTMIKWGTGGHTGVDVNLIGYGPNIERMAGNRDNTEVGQFITDQLGLDLPSATNLLNDKKNEKWLVEKVGRDKVENGVRNLRKRHGHQHD